MSKLFFNGSFLLLAVLFWLPVLLCIGGAGSREYYSDEKEWHLPAVRQIAAKWPALDMQIDCFSASPPGYHWMLAGLSSVSGGALPVIRLWNACFGFGVLILLYAWISARSEPARAFVLLAPLALSNFIIKSAAWVVTDNAGLLFAVAALLAALTTPPQTGRSSVWAALTVFTRHIQAWVLAPLALSVLLNGPPRRLTRLFWLVLPLGVLGLLVTAWGGLVPPQWKAANVGMSTCPQAYLLSLSVGFLILLLPVRYMGAEHVQAEKNWLLAAACGGLLVSLLTVTAYDPSAGRWGGYLWSVASKFPNLAERSAFFLLAAPVGAVLWMLLWRGMMREGAGKAGWLWAAALIAWMVSLVVCRQVFQRYFEPLILIFIALAAVLPMTRVPDFGGRWRWSLLCMFQFLVTILTAVLPVFKGDMAQ
jgi:hypothetical protein